ncbi:MAG: peptidylprolyl isomerase [Gemmatimonadales bacterium]|jgi:cyclophilin family peptidyl-prolyl cis-trans isomerase
MSARYPLALVVGATLLAAGCARREAAAPAAPPDSLPRVVLETSMGRIVLELYRTRAESTVANILRHVQAKFYDGLVWHRVEHNFVIQTGMMTPDYMVRTSSVPPVRIESENGLSNVKYSVGLARGSDRNSGTVQFYINLKDNPALDFKDETARGWGYTVFGRVVEGQAVVDRIGEVPVGRSHGDENVPLQPVLVTSARLEVKPAAP